MLYETKEKGEKNNEEGRNIIYKWRKLNNFSVIEWCFSGCLIEDKYFKRNGSFGKRRKKISFCQTWENVFSYPLYKWLFSISSFLIYRA